VESSLDGPLEIPVEYRLESWQYDLPPDRIAQVPPPRRTASRMMVLRRQEGAPEHGWFADLPRWVRPGDVMVLNRTRVLPARLFARKETGGRVELLVLDPGDPFEALYGTRRGLRVGACLELLDRPGNPTGVRAEVLEVRDGGRAILRLDSGTIREAMDRFGRMPLPPYIRREGQELEDLDRVRYQTVYAREEGAVAAPTAGLHFDEAMIRRLQQAGVEIATVTLHVGPGTFKPVTSPDVRLHDVGEERYRVEEEVAGRINRALREGRRVLAVGTTSVRTLETAGASGEVEPGEGATRLLITPGFRFRVVSGLLTNFHLPGSSLLLLVGAMVGRERLLGAYREAVDRGYRFYSYGDAMLVL